MRKRSPPQRAGDSPSDRSELEGFLVGVGHRLQERRNSGTAVPDLERRLLAAQAAVAGGNLSEAERILLTVSDRLDEAESEPELIEFPRGLVAYDAGADRGIPTPEDEEPVANRLRIVDRLLGVAGAEGIDVAELRVQLAVARTVYDTGDRRAAKQAGERILDELDQKRTHAGARKRI